MRMLDFLRGLKFASPGRSSFFKARIGKVDLGVLKVALMVAALDGEIADDEYATFDRLSKKCRGYTPESARQALDEALRSAGYLMLKARMAGDAALEKTFVAEARAALPNGFDSLSPEDIRKAVVTWIMMGMCDGEYSPRERRCVEALRRQFAEIRVDRARRAEERAMLMSSAYRQACGSASLDADQRLALVSRDFVGRVELLARRLGDSEAAARELKRLIAEGD